MKKCRTQYDGVPGISIPALGFGLEPAHRSAPYRYYGPTSVPHAIHVGEAMVNCFLVALVYHTL